MCSRNPLGMLLGIRQGNVLGETTRPFWISTGLEDTKSGNNYGFEEVSMWSNRNTPKFRSEAIRWGTER